MPVDDSFSKLLLHMDGADASTTFTDEAGNTVTPNGNAQIDTAQSVFGGASGLFDGVGDYLTVPDSADWYLDDGSDANEWTIDFRLRFNGDPGTGSNGLISQRPGATNHWYLLHTNNTLRFLVRASSSDVVVIDNAWNPAGSTWYHVAVVKQGATGYKMFIDGTQIGSTQADSSPMADLAAVLTIARVVDAAGTDMYLSGWMDELRITKGAARWTGDFTPPTSAYGTSSSSGFFLFF